MPEEGIQFIKRDQLLSYEEMERLVRIMGSLGVNKVRITGGEPFLRRDFVHFLEQIRKIEEIKTIGITTNGILTHNYIDDLKRLNINDINLSLDTLDKAKFLEITRRDNFDEVMNTLDLLLQNDFKVKINAVVMSGVNEEDILPLSELTLKENVEMRFIEEMPFNGSGIRVKDQIFDHRNILDTIRKVHPGIAPISTPKFNTSTLYQIPEAAGTIGIIPAFSRTFCGQCDRIRVTAQGQIKTCLYDDGVADIKEILRSGVSDKEVEDLIVRIVSKRAKDGFEAEKNRLSQPEITESMSTIGG